VGRRPATIPCAGHDRRGRPCGLRAPQGEQFCHKHKPGAQPTPLIAAQQTDDPVVLLKRLMKDRDASIRLRALEAFMKWEDRRSVGCPKCEAVALAAREQEKFINGVTDDERERITDLLALLDDEIHAVYDRDPDLTPDGYSPPSKEQTDGPPEQAQSTQPLRDREADTDGTEQQHREPAGTGGAISLETAERERPAADAAPDPDQVAPPYYVPPDRYADVGLFLMEKTNTWTHSFGDDHAQKILSGEITLAQALAEQALSQRRAQRMMVAPATQFQQEQQ
jgi:hypothetical protein